MEKLTAYRAELRDREDKHTPTAVIADVPLKNLADAAPTTLDDMLKVNGIGKAFVTKYGAGFLDVILGEQKPMKLSMMRKESRATLKNLQSRLTNVNRRNRMLYCPKTAAGKAIDLCCEPAIDVLLADKGKATVCDDRSEQYKQYTKLMRATSATLRETGSNTLYVGYPFVVGKCGTSVTFDVCAPLALFPVILENDNGRIVMQPDNDRAVAYNNALILCYNKFNNRATATLPPCELEEFDKRSFVKNTLAFYAGEGIEIKKSAAVQTAVEKKQTKSGASAKTKAVKAVDNNPPQIIVTGKLDTTALEKFPTLGEKSFASLGVNEYALLPCAVIGAFPMYSGAMQKDFDDIIDADTVPPALDALLEGADDITDMYGESSEFSDSVPALESEGNIENINELNVSQENAVLRASVEPAFVMQGPPGTGKSQTITSIISDEVNKGRNVLIVSQKRAALSVIYSRLGRLSRYALFVDDPKDKQTFYGRLKAMFDAADNRVPFNAVKYSRLINAVDADTAALEAVESCLENTDFGAPMLKIYAENFDNRFKTAERSGNASEISDESIFRDCTPQGLLDCGYEDIKASAAYLDDRHLTEILSEYYSLAEKYDWLIRAKKNMSSADLARALSELDGVLDLYAYGAGRIGGRFKFRKALKAFVKSFFVEYDRKLYKKFVKDPVWFFNGVKAYNDFYDTKITADTLDYCTRLYFGTLVNVSKQTGKTPFELNGALSEYCAYAYIDRFETENRNVIAHVKNFPAIVSRICSAIDNKRALTKDKTLDALKSAFASNISESKRRGEMLRAIDGKRRPALSKFVEKFEFELFRGVRVFLMTPEAVSEILPLKNDLFDILVFDEASQIYVERGIPAISRARRIVVCGDHKQLRPSSLGDGRIAVDDEEESEAALEEESLLDLARFKFPEVMLSYHYRSRYEELIAFSNAAFYGGKLNISPNPDPPKAPPINVHKVNGRWEDRINRAEAEKVVELISEHLAENAALPAESRETLGVITFNALQRDHILDLIDKKCDADGTFGALYAEEYSRKKDGEDIGLFVKNIENVQGDERDRIIFSFAYAYNKSGTMSRNFGWLNRPGGENRLNVAISRAKRKIDIVTSIIPSDLKVDDISTTGVHLLRKYLDYAYCVSDGDKSGAKLVLDSFDGGGSTVSRELERSDSLKNRVYAALVEKGYDVERDVGMGNYTIDLAVKNGRGDYVIGVECDEHVYAGDISARERDVMRRKFLTSRGWSVYRVWSSEFYENPDAVIKDILSNING